MTAPRLLLAAVAALAVALAVAGCGGSSGGGGEPAGLAPRRAPVYLEVNLSPEAKESEALDELTKSVLGIESIGAFVAGQLEQAALGSGEKLDYEAEVEPWLGDKAGMYLDGYDGKSFHGYGIALETTDSGEAREFIEKREAAAGEHEKAEYEGDPYYVAPEDGAVLGMVGDYVVFGEAKSDLEAMYKAFEGEGLNESAKFEAAMEAAPGEGVGHVYVDIGGLIEQAKGAIPPEVESFFDLVRLQPRKATAVATVVPRSEQVEVDISTDVGKGPAGGDATKLLESLPATATVGFASAGFGKGFGEGIDELSEAGIPGQLKPGELKPALETVGINLDAITASIGDVGGFLEGSSVGGLGGAMVLETSDAGEAHSTVTNVGLLLRAIGTKGVTAVDGKVSGFSVRSPGLGPKPLIVGTAGAKIVIAYGPKAAAEALRSGGRTLGSSAGFQAGKGALGSTPMSAFLVGPPTLKLVEAILSPAERAKLGEARPYLRKISYVAIGSETSGKTTTAKVIVGLHK